MLDAGDRARDLAGYERLAAPLRLVVEQDAVAGEHFVRLAVVDRGPVAGHLCDHVRAARVKWRLLRLWRWRSAEHLARRCLVEASGHARLADRLEQPQCSRARHVEG